MIEKTSENVKCHCCGEAATVIIGGTPYCANCAKSKEAEEQKELIESFEG